VLLWDLSDGCRAGGILEHKVQEEEGPSIEVAPERTTLLQARWGGAALVGREGGCECGGGPRGELTGTGC
jgi:hypothetical protein